MTDDQGLPEKRRYPFRPETLNLVNFSVYGDSGKTLSRGMGKTLNISRGGVLLEIYNAIPKESRAVLSIGIEDKILEIEAITAHVRSTGDRIWQVGMAFLPMIGQQARLLTLFIKQFEEERDS